MTYSDGNAKPDDALTYKISAGDTFWSISHRFGLSVEQLMSANPGVVPNNLQIGQTINLVPRRGGRAMFMSFAAIPPSTYTIAASDTFWSISQHLGLSIAQLIAANPNVDPTKLRIGEVINLISQHPGKTFISHLFDVADDISLRQ